MPEIHKEIEKSISDKNYKNEIESIECSLEKHIWGQDTQWRIDAEAGSYPCDEMGRSFSFGGYVFLEEVKGRETIHFKTQMYNSFDKITTEHKKIAIHYKMLNDKKLIEAIMRQTNEFLDQFYEKFMAEANIFVQKFRVLKSDS
jgi:hypothetical protein